MIALLGNKLMTYALIAVAAVAAVLSALGVARRSGVKAQEAADVKGELADRKAADRVGQDVAALGDSEAVAALRTEFGRK